MSVISSTLLAAGKVMPFTRPWSAQRALRALAASLCLHIYVCVCACTIDMHSSPCLVIRSQLGLKVYDVPPILAGSRPFAHAHAQYSLTLCVSLCVCVCG